MTKDQIDAVAREAGRFMLVALEAVHRVEKDDYVTITGSKETAALRRASMDLTRALARFRRGDR